MNIGIDLGGTNIAGGLVENGVILKHLTVSTPKSSNPSEIIATIADVANQLAEGRQLSVGIGVPGIVEDRMVYACANLGWTNISFDTYWSEHSTLPFVLGNDATLAGLAEFEHRGVHNGVLLTLGTGLGSSILLSDQVIGGIGSELGHTIVVKGGRTCGCGRKGCLERYASSSALIENTKELLQTTKSRLTDFREEERTGKLIFALAAEGDEVCQKAIDAVAEYLAVGIANIVATLGVDLVLLGGGIAEAGEALIVPTRRHLERYKYFAQMNLPTIEQAKLKNDAGIIGAAELAKRSVK